MDTISLFSVLFFSLNTFQLIKCTQLEYVTCGSVIKLVNEVYRSRLHSHSVKYGSGSGQQSVTAIDDKDDVNSYWSVKGTNEEACKRGTPIKCGSVIRLEHLSTNKNLHSHLFKSPLSGNQEVSAFGENGEGDTGDHWMILCDDVWERDTPVRLKHVDSDALLSVSGRTYGSPIQGQKEVVAVKRSDSASYWKTAEGVFIKPDDLAKDVIHDEL